MNRNSKKSFTLFLRVFQEPAKANFLHKAVLAGLVVWSFSLSLQTHSATAKNRLKLDKVNPKEFYLDQLLKGVGPVLESFLHDSGRFSNGSWTADHQEVIYPLAYLSTLREAKNRYAGDQKLLDAALKGGDALCDAQYEDGTVEFLKEDGSHWGRVYLHKTLTAWMETYELLRVRLDADRRARWERGIQKMVEGVDQQILGKRNKLLYSGLLRDEDVIWGWGNFEVNELSTWDGLNVYRAGQIFNRSDWQQNGQRMIHAALESLDPSGFWPEFGGPSTSCNLSYLEAIGLYYEYSGDLAVVPYLERAVDFQMKYLYPDGSLIETLDGRFRYEPDVPPIAHFALSQFTPGRRLAKFLVTQMIKRGIALPLSSSLLRNYRYYHDGLDEKLPLEKKKYVVASGNKALARRQPPWFYCLSGFTAPPTKNRWGMDRQNFVSVWHDQVGLILTGGNSKGQPEWSNFVFSRGGRPAYIPTAGEVREKNPKDAVLLSYDDRKAVLSISAKSKTELEVQAELQDASASAYGQLVLYLKAGNTLKSMAGGVFSLSEKPIEILAEDSGGWIEYEGWRITLPPGSKLIFPSGPFDPFNRQAKGSLSEARGLLSYRLNASTSNVSFTITVLKL